MRISKNTINDYKLYTARKKVYLSRGWGVQPEEVRDAYQKI